MRAWRTTLSAGVLPFSTHHRLPAQRPVFSLFSDRFGIRKLESVHRFLCDNLSGGEFLGPVGDIATAGAAEIGQAEIALDIPVEPEIQELIGEILVAAADWYGGKIGHAVDAFFRPYHAER